jgi:hypothetical protein
MKKFIIGSCMVISLAFAAKMAFATPGQLVIPVPWYINDFQGIQRSDYDSWLQLKNITDTEITYYIDYFDNSNFLLVATTDTLTIVPQGGTAYYTGRASLTFGMGANADKGSMNIRWDPVTSGNTNRQETRGYFNFIYWGGGYFAVATNFDY